MVAEFVREDENSSPSVFVPLPDPKGRPKLRFHLRVETEQDGKAARRARMPVYWLDGPTVSALGYPMAFPPAVVAAESILPTVETSHPLIPFRSAQALLRPRFEDVALMMLHVDATAGRAIIDRHRAEVDRDYLSRRLLEEALVEDATRVRFFDSIPGLPRWGESYPREVVTRKMRKNPLGGVL